MQLIGSSWQQLNGRQSKYDRENKASDVAPLILACGCDTTMFT